MFITSGNLMGQILQFGNRKFKISSYFPNQSIGLDLYSKGSSWKKESILIVVKMMTLRTVLGLVAIEDMELVQMDVKTAFLHGDLDDDVYMHQPKGFIQEDARREKLVCKLKKALAGLK
ncbi:hypothetical protein L7F22_004761 [Adiantum nelumboides]|nr:hypothetical protein [Adiantum nelumboides]